MTTPTLRFDVHARTIKDWQFSGPRRVSWQTATRKHAAAEGYAYAVHADGRVTFVCRNPDTGRVTQRTHPKGAYRILSTGV